jgi:hypothetical protein
VASTSIALASGLNMLAYPFPEDVTFGSTALAAQAHNGDRLLVFDPSTQSYAALAGTKTVAGWSPEASASVLKIGSGFWYFNSQSQPVKATESRPY